MFLNGQYSTSKHVNPCIGWKCTNETPDRQQLEANKNLPSHLTKKTFFRTTSMWASASTYTHSTPSPTIHPVVMIEFWPAAFPHILSLKFERTYTGNTLTITHKRTFEYNEITSKWLCVHHLSHPTYNTRLNTTQSGSNEKHENDNQLWTAFALRRRLHGRACVAPVM